MVLVLIAAGCGRTEPGGAPVALAESESQEVSEWLVPRFELVHWPLDDLPADASAALDALGSRLSADGPTGPEVRVTRDPDPDAGCLPGDRIWVSEGLLSVVPGEAELAAALAIALAGCDDANRLWTRRADLALPPDRDDVLAARYRDFRLDANALLYTLLTGAQCDDSGCAASARAALDRAGFGGAALDRLLLALRADHPEAALTWRTRALASRGVRPAPQTTPQWLQPFAMQREGLAELAASRRFLSRGELLEAYRAAIRARRRLPDDLRLRMHQAELDLANNHIEYGQRILMELEADGQIVPHADYWWGWVDSRQRRFERAAERLSASIEALPRASAHWRLGEVLNRLDRKVQALKHYQTVLQAGPRHPFHAYAQQRLEREAGS